MSSEQVSLGFSHLQTPPGSHIGYPYRTEQTRLNHLLDFMCAGLQNDDRCIAAITEYSDNLWMDGLRKRGVDPDNLPDGQLDILTPAKLYRCRPDLAQPNADKAFVDYIIDTSNERWNGTRVCTSFNHLLYDKIFIQHFLTAETKANDLLTGRSVTMICTFDAHRLDSRLLDACLQTHPLILSENSVSPNENYVAPEQLIDDLPEIVDRLRSDGSMHQPFAQYYFYSDTPVIRVGGELDIATTPHVSELIHWMINLGHTELVVDLSYTRYMDAGSISMLARFANMLRASGGELTIYDPSATLRKIFQIVKLQEHIAIFREVDVAVQAAHTSA